MPDKRHLGANLPTFQLIIVLPQFLPKGPPLACVRQMHIYSPYTWLSETSSAKNISSQDCRKDSQHSKLDSTATTPTTTENTTFTFEWVVLNLYNNNIIAKFRLNNQKFNKAKKNSLS